MNTKFDLINYHMPETHYLERQVFVRRPARTHTHRHMHPNLLSSLINFTLESL